MLDSRAFEFPFSVFIFGLFISNVFSARIFRGFELRYSILCLANHFSSVRISTCAHATIYDFQFCEDFAFVVVVVFFFLEL